MRFVLLALVTLSLSACCASLPEKAIDTVKSQAAGNDRYTELVTLALAGEADFEEHGIASVSHDDVASTPAPVRVLIQRLLDALHTNRFAAHSALFQLDLGSDPAGLFEPIEFPGPPDESDGLLEDE